MEGRGAERVGLLQPCRAVAEAGECLVDLAVREELQQPAEGRGLRVLGPDPAQQFQAADNHGTRNHPGQGQHRPRSGVQVGPVPGDCEEFAEYVGPLVAGKADRDFREC